MGPSKDGIDVFSKIDAQRDVIDIPEYGTDAVMSYKAIKYPPCDSCGIISSIGNCYPRHLLNPRIVGRLLHQCLQSY